MKKNLIVVGLIIGSGVAVANSEYPISGNPNGQIAAPSTIIGVANLCSTPVWIQYTGPDATLPTIVKVDPFYQFDYPVSSAAGTSSLRFTPKFYCDSTGNNCSIGEQSETATIPDINTLFEATVESAGFIIANGGAASTYDISLVDGFTIPAVVKVFQDPNENNGQCTDIDDGGLPLPPFMLNPNDSQQIARFNQMCVASSTASDYTQSHNSFFSPFVAQGVSPSSYDMSWFASPVPNNATSTLALLSPVLINPNANKAIGCASPSGRLSSIYAQQTGSLQDKQGIFRASTGCNPTVGSCQYDADVMMASCPFSSADIANEITAGQGTAAYLSQYDKNAGVSAANNPFWQLIQNFRNFPGFTGKDAEGNTTYNASLLCKYGPAGNSYWTQMVHNTTTFTYAYSYDDNSGTRVCNNSNSKMVFVTCGSQP